MTIEYDTTKNQTNIRKHHINFETARAFMTVDPDIEFDLKHIDDELRYRGITIIIEIIKPSVSSEDIELSFTDKEG